MLLQDGTATINLGSTLKYAFPRYSRLSLNSAWGRSLAVPF
jgi:hypothetical protein